MTDVLIERGYLHTDIHTHTHAHSTSCENGDRDLDDAKPGTLKTASKLLRNQGRGME